MIFMAEEDIKLEEQKPKCLFCKTEENVKALFSDNNELQCLVCDQCFPTKIAKFKPESSPDPFMFVKKMDEIYIKEFQAWIDKFKSEEGLRESKKGLE